MGFNTASGARHRRNTTSRDLPALILVFGFIFAAAALSGLFASDSFLPKESDLRTISGLVQREPYITGPGKGGSKLHIFVLASDGLHDLTQDDMGHLVPGIMDPLMNLRAGDNVTARVKHDFVGRNLDWLWAMQRDGITILSYQDTHLFMERMNVRVRQLCRWAGVLAIVSFVGAILLRAHFGSWKEASRAA